MGCRPGSLFSCLPGIFSPKDYMLNLSTILLNNIVLIDIQPKTGKVIKWAEKKQQNIAIARSCARLAEKNINFKGRAYKLDECGRYLEFKAFPSLGEKKLFKANFCKYRLCPMCSWRRSLKIFGQASQVMDVAMDQDYKFLFLTLTVKNCKGSELSGELNKIYHGLTKFTQRKEIRHAFPGWMRTLEITHNVDRFDKSFDTYHPHIHFILAVKQSYFNRNSRLYLSQARFTDLWRESMGLDYNPRVHIEKVMEGKGHIKEVSKYAVKPSDMINEDFVLMDSSVMILDDALKNRRLVGWGGVLKKIKKDLALDDAENGDLINVDGEQELNPDLEYIIEKYYWHAGFRQYVKSEKKD